MKFDYAIGNPPYQDQRGGTKNIDIWPNFLKESRSISNKVCMIHPGRWIIPTKTRENLRNEIINSNLKIFDYYPNGGDVFPGFQIGQGISITLFDNTYTNNILYKINGEYQGEYREDIKFFSSKLEKEAYTKVFNNIDTNHTMEAYVKGGIGTLGGSDKYNYLDEESSATLKDNNIGMKEPIRVWATLLSGRSGAAYNWYWIEKDNIKNIADYQFTSRKVMIDKKGYALVPGHGNVFNHLPQICDKYTYGVNVLWFFPKHDTDRELELIKSLFMTKTVRYLMCITQKSLCVRGFENVPDYLELAKLLPENQLFTDEWFYKTFDFSSELINEIETRVSEKIDK